MLQDSHWASGAFGYFPSYLLGTLIACQLHEKLQDVFPDLPARVEEGRLREIAQWLKLHVHQFGRGKSTRAILQDCTGATLQSASFLKLISQRFIP